MTTAERNNLNKRAEELNSRIRQLSYSDMAGNPVVQDIIKEYNEECIRLHEATSQRREYLYNFIGGGWNSEYALTMEDAIQQAKARFPKEGGSEIDEKTFRISTPSDYQNLMSMFY